MEKLKTKQQTEARSNGNTRGEPNLKPNSNPNPFKRPMNALQKQWYRVLLARRVGFGQKPTQDEKEPT